MGTMGVMTDEEDAAERRHRFVTASSARVWRITAVACAAILGLGLGAAAVIQGQAARDREQSRDRALARQQASDIACVRRWAISYNNRAETLNGLSEARNKALDTLLLAAIDRAPRAEVQRLAAQYRDLVLRRRATLAANPLPPSPEFVCGLTDRKHPAQPSPTADPDPSPARPTSPPRTAGRSPATPATPTRRVAPAKPDPSRPARARVSPTRSTPPRAPGAASTVTITAAPSASSSWPIVRLPLPCITVGPLLATC